MIFISYHDRTRKFHVECHYNDNGLVKNFPSRRFDLKRKLWVVPVCRKNIEFMEQIPPERVDIDDGARRAIAKHNVKTAAVPTLPFPVSYPFKTEPYSQQRTALNLCWNKPGFMLSMEMGTGKSKVAVDKASCHFFNGEINGVIIFCPVSIRTNWIEEIYVHCPIDLGWKKHADGSVSSPAVMIADTSTITQAKALDEFLSTAMPFKVLIVGMESIQSGNAVETPGKAGNIYPIVERFALAHNHMQVIDEAHNIKSPDSNRTVNITKLGLMAKYKLPMTGTPVLQGLLDMFAYFEYIDPEIIGIGDYSAFKARYAILSEDGFKRVVAYDNLDELLSILQPYVYQVKKSECMDLPEKQYQVRTVKLSAAQREVYTAIQRKKLYENGDIKVEVNNALQKYSALQTIVGGFINFDRAVVGQFVPEFDAEGKAKTVRDTLPIVDWKSNPKITELLHCLEEIGPDEQAIIWAVHTFELRQIRDALENKYGNGCVAEFYGAIGLDERDYNKRAFNAGKKRFFVANQAAGGVGLTLNAAAYTFYLSNTFKLKDRLQSEDRNHRIGQTRNVLYTTIVAAGTVDIDIMRSIHDKKDFADWVSDQFAEGNRDRLSI